MQVEYGKFSATSESLPHVTIAALLSRGVNHVMGNEVAATISGRIARAVWPGVGEDGKPNGKLAKDAPEGAERTAAIKAFRAANADLVQGWVAEEQAAVWAELLDGTIGVSTRGPSVDPVESRMRSIARTEVITTLKANNIKVPKKAEDTVQFADGSTKTMVQMVATRLERFGDRIKKEAEKALGDEARKAKRIAEEAVKADSTAEGLGL